MTERGQLTDGTPWSVLVILDVPAGAVPADADRLVLQDQEGSPLAVLSITERLPHSGAGAEGEQALVRLAGPVTALREPEHGPFRALRRHPQDVRAELAGTPEAPGGNVLAYATRRPLNRRHIGQLRHYAGQLNARLLVLPLVSGPAEIVTRPEALVRAVLAARPHLPAGTLIVPVPLAPRNAVSGRAGLRRPARPGQRGRGLRRYPPAGRRRRRPGRGRRPAARAQERHADAARSADPGHQRRRVGLRPAVGSVAPARADRTGSRAGRADRFRARRAARFRRRGSGLVRSAERGAGAAPGPAAAGRTWPGHLLHRPVRVRQVHHRPRAGRGADRTGRPHRLAARRRPRSGSCCPPGSPSPGPTGTSTSRASVSSRPRSPGMAASRSARRSRPTPRRGRPPARWSARSATSCWSTSPLRWTSARRATARACTPRPAPG